jgi:hypothetical protein
VLDATTNNFGLFQKRSYTGAPDRIKVRTLTPLLFLYKNQDGDLVLGISLQLARPSLNRLGLAVASTSKTIAAASGQPIAPLARSPHRP